jgi:hypothetical protein
MTQSLLVYDPVAPRQEKPTQSMKALDALAGKVVGFIDNAKPNFNFLVEDLSALLQSRHGIARVIVRRKRGPSIAAPAAMVEELCASCDAVIVGSGD